MESHHCDLLVIGVESIALQCVPCSLSPRNVRLHRHFAGGTGPFRGSEGGTEHDVQDLSVLRSFHKAYHGFKRAFLFVHFPWCLADRHGCEVELAGVYALVRLYRVFHIGGGASQC